MCLVDAPGRAHEALVLTQLWAGPETRNPPQTLLTLCSWDRRSTARPTGAAGHARAFAEMPSGRLLSIYYSLALVPSVMEEKTRRPSMFKRLTQGRRLAGGPDAMPRGPWWLKSHGRWPLWPFMPGLPGTDPETAYSAGPAFSFSQPEKESLPAPCHVGGSEARET